ncbi:MAG: bifunctional 4-hydroxy-3-methylbut-2-enyl diphosphate reductase/30S ribosomal protein S1 [Oscillospiraceae bacterium]|jgi:4-hydroxy-3-methylbut-2-enyl diphosphate reductase|nr:bifunctional 4-hydroxy-3-methylbut-2-enyl diphosphate reductase/30S ribosomal protein S1 [Oscillospiraceae bacterium]
MPITTAKRAGYCFGVARAVKIVEDLLDQGEKVETLGPIIHNPQMVDKLAKRGVRIIDDIAQHEQGSRVVIRSHGVSRNIIDALTARNIPFTDATCPDVAKIHTIAREQSALGKTVFIAGDATHSEVAGIISNCVGPVYCFADLAGLKTLSENVINDDKKDYILIAQTTFEGEEWKKCREFAKNVYTNIIIFDTICNATMLRQREADELSLISDCMVVVGGKNSSNTEKLARICEKNCPTILVEDPEELRGRKFGVAKNIGVTAGASTPAFIIKEVQRIMSDAFNNQDEMSFEEMLDQSFKTINSKEKVKAIVTNVSSNEIAVDIGTKHAGYVPLNEYTDDPNAKLDELVKVGDEIELMVLRVNDVEGTAMLSKKRLDAIAGFEKVMNAAETEEILEGMVVDVVKGGVIALTNGVRVFIPASQATMTRGQELETLLRQPVSFKILEVNKNRRRAVGSIRAVLKDQMKVLEDKFWESAAVGNVYKGTVKSLTSYGAFVDLGGVDGMIHISELSWSRIKHPSEVVNVGDVVEVYVKDIDPETRKISLGYKKNEDNPWEVLAREYKTGDTVEVKVVSMTPFGAFARVIPGVDGLIHISQISLERINKPADVLEIGQDVTVKITDIDFEKKRVSLSIRALLEANQAVEEENAKEETDGAVVYEAAPPESAEADPAPETEEDAIQE